MLPVSVIFQVPLAFIVFLFGIIHNDIDKAVTFWNLVYFASKQEPVPASMVLAPEK